MSDLSYCVSSNKLYGGAYSGDPDPVIARRKLTILLELAVSLFINLMEADEREQNGRLFRCYRTGSEFQLNGA
jgi:hypothetical protein